MDNGITLNCLRELMENTVYLEKSKRLYNFNENIKEYEKEFKKPNKQNKKAEKYYKKIKKLKSKLAKLYGLEGVEYDNNL